MTLQERISELGPDCEQLTLFPVDFLASPFPWPESKPGKTTSVISSLKCSGLSPSLSRITSSVKTYLESCQLPLKTLSRVWSVKAIGASCLILKLRLSERRIGEKESSLWLSTLTAYSGTKGRSAAWAKGKTPTPQEFVRLYPTHRVGGSKGSSPVGVKHGDLAAVIGGQLNPEWTEWFMGFPIGWTELEPSETP